jgi:phytoene dehydrogenase-like protein
VAILTEGYHLPQGGMGVIPKTLADAFEEQGGKIYLNTKVKRIVVKDERAQGLEIKGQGIVEADVILSTASGMTTFLSLMKPEDAPVKMREKAKNAPLSANRFFNVQLGLANRIDVDSQVNYALPMMEEQRRFIHPGPDDTGIFIYSVPTVTLPELAPEGGSVVEVFAATGQEIPADGWDEEMKASKAEAVIEALFSLHHMDIVTRRVRSPRDYQTGLNLYKGKIYGLSPAISPGDYFPHKSPLPGLYLAGQTTHPGYGIMPSIMSGILAAEKIVKI